MMIFIGHYQLFELEEWDWLVKLIGMGINREISSETGFELAKLI